MSQADFHIKPVILSTFRARIYAKVPAPILLALPVND